MIPARRVPYEDVEKQLVRLFRSILFDPLLEILKESAPAVKVEVFNAVADVALQKALRGGVIQYAGGIFSGKFTSAISKALRGIGARFDKRARVYRLDKAICPEWVVADALVFREKAKAVHESLRKAIDKIGEKIDEAVEAKPVDAEDTISAIEAGWKKSARDLELHPTLDEASRARLTADYTDNMKLWVKKFSEDQIGELRSMVERNAERGYRFDSLIDGIQQRFGVSQSKAKFLARQETSLMMSKFNQQRFGEAGVTQYTWSTSHDERVRDRHKHLDGQMFSYTHPPIVDAATGRRANPGEDFLCFPGESRVDFGAGVEKCFRRWYSGELTTVVLVSGKTIRATPNHPVLTALGWKPIGLLNDRDQVVCLREDLFFPLEADLYKSIPSFREIFESFRESGFFFSFPGESVQFHGDGSDGDVDVVGAARFLEIHGKPGLLNKLAHLDFSKTDFSATSGRRFFGHKKAFPFRDITSRLMAAFGQMFSLFDRKTRHPYFVRFGLGSNGDGSLNQSPSDNNSFKACSFRNRKLTFAGDIRVDDGFWVKLKSIMPVLSFQVCSVRNSSFCGHVYNLQTKLGYYTVDGVIVSNCRCVAIPVMRPK
jgi:SPP1 gp7 family putative phage head morphogenesis protein